MNDEYYMKEAIKEAKKAYKLNEVPVGCVIVIDNKIIARAHNLRHNKKNTLYHAELIAINEACNKLGRWILDDASIYVTLEPCLMCSGAIIQARFKRLIYGKNEPKFGCVESYIKIFDNPRFNHHVEVRGNICGEEIETLMVDFFHNLRKQKN